MDGWSLRSVDGFTPVIDVLVEELGLMPALIYGAVWRNCQMRDGLCSASLEMLAARTGVDRRTVLRHIKTLCDLGYLEDLDHGLRHRPHRYRDTGMVLIGMALVAKKQRGVTESHTSDPGVTESPTRSDTESHLGVTESHLKIHSEDTIKDTEDVDANASTCAPGPAAEDVHHPAAEAIIRADTEQEQQKKKANVSPEEQELRNLQTRAQVYFERRTGLVCPTGGKRNGTAVLWYHPLREIVRDLAQGDADRAKELIDASLERLEGLTVSSPKSIVNTARAIAAESSRAREGPAAPPGQGGWSTGWYRADAPRPAIDTSGDPRYSGQAKGG